MYLWMNYAGNRGSRVGGCAHTANNHSKIPLTCWNMADMLGIWLRCWDFRWSVCRTQMQLGSGNRVQRCVWGSQQGQKI